MSYSLIAFDVMSSLSFEELQVEPECLLKFVKQRAQELMPTQNIKSIYSIRRYGGGGRSCISDIVAVEWTRDSDLEIGKRLFVLCDYGPDQSDFEIIVKVYSALLSEPYALSWREKDDVSKHSCLSGLPF